MYQIWICSSLLVTSNAANGAPKEYAQGQTQHGKKNWFILEPSKTKTLSTSGKSEEPSQLPFLSQYIMLQVHAPTPLWQGHPRRIPEAKGRFCITKKHNLLQDSPYRTQEKLSHGLAPNISPLDPETCLASIRMTTCFLGGALRLRS